MTTLEKLQTALKIEGYEKEELSSNGSELKILVGQTMGMDKFNSLSSNW
jgi:hypothetical protein